MVFLHMESINTELVDNYSTNSEEETAELGRTFAKRLLPGDVVAFYGDLGAGKTEFIRGICTNYNVKELVTSPTFTIMNQYSGEYNNDEIKIFHIDLYRIKNQNELEEIGFDDCIYSKSSIKLIEWAEKAEERLGNLSYEVNIKLDENEDSKRKIEILKLN